MNPYIHNSSSQLYYHSFSNQREKKKKIPTMAKPSLLLGSIFLSIFILPCLSCPEYQKQALLQFKSFIPAVNYSFDSSTLGLESWNSSSSCCEWNLITCSSPSNSTSRAVIGLYLSALSNILTRLFLYN